MIGSEPLEGSVYSTGNLGEALEESLEIESRKRNNPFQDSDTTTGYVDEVAMPNLERKKEVKIEEKYDKEYPGWRDEKIKEAHMVPCTFVDKGKKNAKNGAKAERKLYKTLQHSNDEDPIQKFLTSPKEKYEKSCAFVFHGQIHEGTEIDFIKIDMTGVNVFECKGITRPGQAQGRYDDACVQLNESIPKLNLEDDIPVNSVVAFPLCQETKIDLDGNVRPLFKEHCENPPSFNKWLSESYKKKYFSAKTLTYEQYLKLVQKFLSVYHTGSGTFSQYKRRAVSDPADNLERATRNFYTKEQAEVLHADRSQDMWIDGCAGSGKTFLLKKRVEWLAQYYKHEEKKRILVVTFNVAINKEIKLALQGVQELVRVQTFDKLIRHILRSNDGDSSVSNKPNTKHADLLNQILKDDSILKKYFKKAGMFKYDHILIDEAQDLSGNWLQLMRKLLNASKNESSIWVFSDPYQLIRRGISMSEDQKKSFKEQLITRVIRNTHEVYEAYQYYFEESKSSIKPTVDHDVYGMPPEYIDAECETDIHEKAFEKLIELQQERVSYLDIAVITQGNSCDLQNDAKSSSAKMREFLESKKIPCVDAEKGTQIRYHKRKPNNPPVIVDTVQRFKGLEAKVLIFCIVGNWEPRDVDFYVGFSRSFCHLIVLGKSATITGIREKQAESKK